MLAGYRPRSPTVPDSSLTSDRFTYRHPRSPLQLVATADRFTPATADRFTDCGNQPIASTPCLTRSLNGLFTQCRSPATTSARAFAEPANGEVVRRQMTQNSHR
ncbi:MAG: hypothetical protein HC769_35175 [Cyanobacteria bacterium CRU_2_1]|nr:hypothetical protein [Cyanobacteria bacterium CRU_2_1]